MIKIQLSRGPPVAEHCLKASQA